MEDVFNQEYLFMYNKRFGKSNDGGGESGEQSKG